jgi:hypothetical protein
MGSIEIEIAAVHLLASADCGKNNPSKRTGVRFALEAVLCRPLTARTGAASELQANLCFCKDTRQGKNKEGEDQCLHNPGPAPIEVRIEVRNP